MEHSRTGEIVALALGSNLGDRQANLKQAIGHLSSFVTHLTFSSVYESPALMKPGAPEAWNLPYLNMVVAGQTSLDPWALLQRTQAIEAELGRPSQREVWSPRTMDVDIVCYGDVVMREEALILPHPAILERAFVMLPLAEVLPDYRYPVPGEHYHQKIAELAASYHPAPDITKL